MAARAGQGRAALCVLGVALEMSSAWMKCRKSQNVTKLISNYVGYFVCAAALGPCLAEDLHLCFKSDPNDMYVYICAYIFICYILIFSSEVLVMIYST